MALTVTVTRGYNFVASTQVSVDDFNAAALPSVTLTGAVGSSDMANGAVGVDQISDQLVNGLPVITALAVGDKFFVYDLSGAENAGITVANSLNGLFGLAPVTTFFTDFDVDTITSHDGTTAQRMTVAYFAESLLGQAPVRTETADADGVLILDASATAGGKAALVTLTNLLPDKGTAGTYSNISSVTTDAKGRVTEIISTGGTTRYNTASPLALPTAAGAAGAAVDNTGLSAEPGIVQVKLICTDAGGDAGWSQNDVVLLSAVFHDEGGGSDWNPTYVVELDGATVRLYQPLAASGSRIVRKDTGVAATFTASKWKWYTCAIL